MSAVVTNLTRLRTKGVHEVREWDKVRELYDEGASKSAIARRLDMSRNTVARLLTYEEPPRYRREPAGSQLDPFKSVVLEMLDKNADIPATVIRDHLRQQGYGGGITILREYVAMVRPKFKVASGYPRTTDGRGERLRIARPDTGVDGAVAGNGACRRASGATKRRGRGARSRNSHELHSTAQRILTAATTVLVEQGYEGMTLEAIAAEARANKSGVWYYFGGKQQLLLAVAENIIVTASGVHGGLPHDDATLGERIELIIGGPGERGDRIRRFAAFYELMTHASRNEELQDCIRTHWESWYNWAAAVISPAIPECDANDRKAIASFASLLLDGIFVETIIAAPGFNPEAAWRQVRLALECLISLSVNQTESVDSASRRIMIGLQRSEANDSASP